VGLVVLVALLVCLIPTTIGGLLSAIGVAGMSRMMQANVIATGPGGGGRRRRGRAAAGQDRHHHPGQPPGHGLRAGAGRERAALADAAQLASLADETPEGRSIVVLAKQRFQLRERELAGLQAEFVPFTAQTRMSGVDLPQPGGVRQLRKGAADAVRRHVERWAAARGAAGRVEDVARRGSTPLVVADGRRALGVVELKDIVKGGIRSALPSCAAWASRR
jgi:K+-transporting ATPase ATPase B chain